MGQNISNRFIQLAEEGQSLIDEGYTITFDGTPLPPAVNAWQRKSRSTIETIYKGKHSPEAKSFSGTLEDKVQVLRALADKEADKHTPNTSPSLTFNQNISIHNEIVTQLYLNIEYAIPEEQKEEVRQLVNDIQEEVKKPQTNWQKVTELLKRGLDYGFKIGPELVKLAEAYYKAKGQ